MCLCSGCDGCWVCIVRCGAVGARVWKVQISCRYCTSVSCVHPVVVLNNGLQFVMLVKDARGDYMEEAYARAGLITAL